MHKTRLPAILPAVVLLVAMAGCDGGAGTRFKTLVETEWQRQLKENPVSASLMGYEGYHREWPDRSLAAIKASQARDAEVLAILEAMDSADLPADERLNYRLFKYNYRRRVMGARFPAHLLPFDHRGGVQLDHELAEVLGLHSPEDFDDWLERLRGFGNRVDGEIELARQGLARGYSTPRLLMERVARQIELHRVSEPTDSPFYKAFGELPDALPAAERQRLQAEAARVIGEVVVPAMERLAAYVADEYLPASRATVGLSALPEGADWYRYLAWYHTTTEQTPDEIHRIGLAEVARIRGEMEALIESLEWRGSFSEFLVFLRTDSRFYYETGEELHQAYLATSKRIDPMLVRLFSKLPRTPYGIRPIPAESAPDTTTAYYYPPAADGSRAGYYYVNLYRPEVRPKYEIEVLSAHEAVPGHHLQIALAQELEALPMFRRQGRYTAYVEGWGLYSEGLGEQLGLYRDPYSKFGQLTYEMWRAIRLVVDTGLHYKDWSRQRAIDFFLANAAKSEKDIVNEIDRYISIPGQALAYKMGQLKLVALRARARQALGDDFDIRDFHRVVLEQGPLPLEILQEQVEAWHGGTGD